MPVITNFGDVTTQGNTTLQQNLTVQGASATFSGSILAASSAVGIGNAASTFGALYATAINATTLNTTSMAGFVGIGTAVATATLQVQGNVAVSNALSATNVSATGGMNTITLNTGSLTVVTSVGIGTVPQTGGATLYVVGNVYASNAVTTTGIQATSANLSSSLNVNSVISLVNVGVGTTPVIGGANLAVQGNISASNALSTTNVSTTGLNTTTINTLSFFGQSGLIGVNTSDPSGTALYVVGNVLASNTVTTTNVSATLANLTSMNVQTISGPTGFIALNAQDPSSTTLYVGGNLYASNSLSTTVLSATSANTGSLNVMAIYGQSSYIGINTTNPSGTSLYVPGNVSASNALTTVLLSATQANIVTLNATTIAGQTGFVGVNTTVPSGTSLYVLGNASVSNALTTVLLSATQANIVTLNATTITGQSGFVGINTTDPSGTALYIAGNLYASNALVSPNIVTTNINATTLNTTSFFTQTGLVGINTTNPSGTNIYVAGNVNVSNALSTTNISATTGNITTMNVQTIFGPTAFVGVNTTAPSGTTLYVLGNVYASNALTTTNISATTGNIITMNTSSIFGQSGFVGVNTTAPSGTTLYVAGNLYASNALVSPNIVTTNLNATTINTTSIFAQTGFVGINTTAPSGTTLYVLGNVYASNALSATNVSATTGNITTLNLTTLVSQTGFLGINTSVPSGTALYVAGNVYASNALATPNLFTTTLNTTSIFGQTGFIGVNTTAPSGTTLYVLGNIYASNALSATNVSATTGNITTLNTQSIFGPTAFVGVNTTNPSGTTLYVLGNLSVSNGLSTTNVFTTNLNATTINTTSFFGQSGFVGINTTNPSGTSLYVLGNISASNALTTTNISATTGNIATMNTQSILGPTGFVGVNTTAPSGTTLYVSGNLYTSNAISAPSLIAPTVNATTINTLSIFGQSGFVGVNTTAPSGTALYIAGNLYATTTLQYGEDLNKRAPFLAPSAANSNVITNWLSATCNAAGQPTDSWWATSQIPTYGNVATGPKGSSDYAGSVLLPDGRVLFVPQNASNVGFYNPKTLLFSTASPAGLTGATSKFRGGVLCPNGNVVFVPWLTSNVGLFNPLTSVYSNISVGASGVGGNQLRFQGGVLGPTGNVIMIPRDSANIGVFNPTTLTLTNVGPIYGGGASLFGGGTLLPNGNVVMVPLNGGAGCNIGMYNSYSLSATGYTNVGPIGTTGTWESAVLAPNGNVVIIPSTSTNVIVYNPASVASPLATSAYTNIFAEGRSGGTWAFTGGALLPSGNIICVPVDSQNVGMIDPTALTYANSTPVGGGVSKFMGGSLTVGGQVVFAPQNSSNVGIINTMVPAPQEFCMNPLFNKF